MGRPHTPATIPHVHAATDLTKYKDFVLVRADGRAVRQRWANDLRMWLLCNKEQAARLKEIRAMGKESGEPVTLYKKQA